MRSEKDIDVDAIKTKVVDIHAINLLSFNYPLAVIDVSCSEGTYIRSIARDLGGHLTKLRRLESNKFKIETALTLDQLIAKLESGTELEDLLIPSAKVLDLPMLEFDTKEVIDLQQGREVSISTKTEASPNEDNYFKCLDDSRELVALGIVGKRKGDLVLQPKIVL
jgi:tRNA pseudouridine55 synthase